jgi:hypothetical protein
MVTPKGSMSTEGESMSTEGESMSTEVESMSTDGKALQVSVQPDSCSICPPLVTYRATDGLFSHTLDSLGRWPLPACSFRSAKAATLLQFNVPPTNCLVRRWFCAVHGPKWFCAVHGPKWFCAVHGPKWFCAVHGPKPSLHRHN